jgi:hypothetical protein
MKEHYIKKPILIFLMASFLLSNCQPGTKPGTSLVVATPVPLNLPGLVAYYPFNGNADDLSSNHINGQVKNAVLTKDRFGFDKNAYEFNGVDSSITFDSSMMPLGNSPRTISAWINAESYPPEPYAGLGSRATVIGWGISDWNLLSEMQIVNSLLNFHCYCQKEGYYQPKLELNRWYHLAIVYADGKVTLYVNGNGETYDTMVINTSAGSGRIGAYPDPKRAGGTIFPNGYDLSYFHGAIDDISIYNQALDAEQIKLLYSEGGWGT